MSVLPEATAMICMPKKFDSSRLDSRKVLNDLRKKRWLESAMGDSDGSLFAIIRAFFTF